MCYASGRGVYSRSADDPMLKLTMYMYGQECTAHIQERCNIILLPPVPQARRHFNLLQEQILSSGGSSIELS